MSTHYKTNVTLYSGIPLDPSYHDVLTGSITDKKTKFDAHYTHIEKKDIQFVKIDTETSRGTVRLEISASWANKANYMYIENKSIHGDTTKLFAFVLGARYLNDGATQPIYEFSIQKDVFASEFTGNNILRDTPILRHSPTNRWNNPRLPEEFPADDYMIYSQQSILDNFIGDESNREYMSVIMYTDKSTDEGTANIYGLPTGCKFFCIATDGVQLKINELSEDESAQICAVYCIPRYFLKGNYQNSFLTTDNFVDHTDIDVDVYFSSNIDKYNNIKMKKCYYYPFNKLQLVNSSGNTVDYALENWKHDGVIVSPYYGTVKLRAKFSGIPPVYYTVEPIDYQDIDSDISAGFRIRTEDFPLGSWVTDAYYQFLGTQYGGDKNQMIDRAIQKFSRGVLSSAATGFTTGLAGGIIGATAGAVTGAVSQLASNAVGGAMEYHNTVQALKNSADAVGGVTNAGNIDAIQRTIDIYMRQVALRPERMHALNAYFQKFGYNQGGIVGTPNFIVSDLHYVYVKTGGPVVVNAGNTTETSIVNTAFMNGVRVWKISDWDYTFDTVTWGVDNVTPEPKDYVPPVYSD